MNYSDFRTTYKWMLAKYPGTAYVFSNDMDAEIGTVEIINYKKIGGKWKETEKRTESFSAIYYANVIDAVPTFKAFGAAERIECAYTRLAYLPVMASSTSPCKTLKTVRKFKFN